MFTNPGYAPWWTGLFDAAGVLLALGVWFVVRSEAWSRLRDHAGVAGSVLLLLVAGRQLAVLSATGFPVGFPGFFGVDESDRNLLGLALLLGCAAAGVFAASYGSGDDDLERGADTDAEPEPEPEPVVVAAPIPTRAWSRTEVLDDRPERDAPRVPRAARARTLPRPWADDPATFRTVAVPLLAVALAVALPLQAQPVSGGFDSFGIVPQGSFAEVVAHLLTGLLVGGALLGTAIALDVWESRLAVSAFALSALVLGVHRAWPGMTANDLWAPAMIGLAAGLLAPAVPRVLRGLVVVDRPTLVAGAAVALALAFLASAAAGYAAGRILGDIDLLSLRPLG